MSKCLLGEKKKEKISRITGWKVRHAYVRGGWDHFWAEVWFEGIYEVSFKQGLPHVNYKTGEIDWGNFPKRLLEEKGQRFIQ